MINLKELYLTYPLERDFKNFITDFYKDYFINPIIKKDNKRFPNYIFYFNNNLNNYTTECIAVFNKKYKKFWCYNPLTDFSINGFYLTLLLHSSPKIISILNNIFENEFNKYFNIKYNYNENLLFNLFSEHMGTNKDYVDKITSYFIKNKYDKS